MDCSGNIIYGFNFGSSGRHRDPNTWKTPTYPETLGEPLLFDRGYTMHEHLDVFGLINMNGRMYDPWLGRFLSPDPFVQAPTFSQSYNRYSYVLNNPLKYVDPSGYYFGPPLDFKLGRGAFAPLGTPFDMGDRGQINFYFNVFGNSGHSTGYETESTAQYDAGGNFTGYTQETKLVSRDGNGEVVGTVARKGSVETDYAGYILYVKDKNGNLIVYAIEDNNGNQIIVNPGIQGEAFLVPIEEYMLAGSEGGSLPDMTYGELSGDIEKFSGAEKAALITAAASSPFNLMTGIIKNLSVAGKNADLIKLGRYGIRGFGIVGIAITGYTAISDGQLTIGDGAQVLLSGAVFIPYVGWAYGAADIGVLLITGSSVTERVGSFVDEHWGPGPIHP